MNTQQFDLNRTMGAAQAALGAGRLDEAERLCKLVLDQIPVFPPATFFLAMISARRGHVDQAIARFKTVIELEPNAFEAVEWLANLLRDQKRFDESLALCERMIQLRPGHPSGPSAAGLCYIEMEMPLKALKSMQLAVEFAPDSPATHFLLARTLEQLLRIDDAASEYKKAIELAPKEAVFHDSLGKLLFQNDRKSESIEYLRKGVELTPSLGGLAMLANALKHEGDYEGAVACYRQALRLDPKVAVTHDLIANALQVLGRFREADDHFLKAIELDPTLASAYLGITKAKQFGPSDRLFVTNLEALIADDSRSQEELRSLRYALGKAFDDLGEYEKAITNFDQANQLSFQTERKGVPFDLVGHRKWIDAQIETFTKSFFEKNRDLGSQSETPVFIVGMIRSGTTLVEQILSSHRDVGEAGELTFWTQPERTTLIRKLIVDDFPGQELKSSITEYLELLDKAAHGFARVTDKMPLNYMTLGLIHLLFPKARIIHCRRSPIDTCLSMYMTPFASAAEFCYNRESIVAGYREYLRLMEHWRAILPAESFMEMDYESLIADREKVMREIVSFCGLGWDDSCLHHEQNERAVRTPSRWQVRQPVYGTSVEKWRHYEPWLREFKALLPG